jgi:hypothetical protein
MHVLPETIENMAPEINVGTVIVEKKPGGATERIFQSSCLH